MSANEPSLGGTTTTTEPSAPPQSTPTEPSAPPQNSGTPNTAQPQNADWSFDSASIPQGIDQGFINEYQNIAKGLGLSKDIAHKLLEQAYSSAEKIDQETVTRQANEWVKAAQNDPMIGGANFKQNLAIAKRGVTAYDKSGEFMQMLEETGLGNNPVVIKFLYALGKDVGEDGFIKGGQGGQPKTFKDAADLLYGTVG